MSKLLIENPFSKNDVANWAEYYVCVSKSNLSKSELLSHIESSSGSEPDSSFVDDVWQELSFREFLYGVDPPYTVDNRDIICKMEWENFPEYLTCLILNLDGNGEDSVATGKLFERISSEALKSYMGGDAIIYGFPSKQSVEDIALTLNERFNYNPTSNFRDRGVDVIAWKSFDDNRKSQIVCLMQCAAGYNWKKKLLEVALDAWRSYISWSGSLPIKGFAVPVVIDESIFHETVLSAGLMLDRPRIYKYIKNTTSINHALRSELVTWCTQRISFNQN